jgi:hypothetical protein
LIGCASADPKKHHPTPKRKNQRMKPLPTIARRQEMKVLPYLTALQPVLTLY